MGDKSKIDKLFSDGLNDFEASPQSDSWARINATIDKKQQKKRGLYWRWASIVAAVGLAFYTGYYFNDNDSFDTYPKTTKHQPAISQPESISHDENSEENEEQETKAISPQAKPDESNNKADISSTKGNNIVGNAPNAKKTVAPTQDETSVSNSLNSTKGEGEANSVSFKNEDATVSSSYSTDEPIEDSGQEVITGDESERNTVAEMEANETSEVMADTNNKTTRETVDYVEKTNSESESLSRFSVSAMVSPTFPFTDVTVNQADENTQNNVKQEKLKTSYSYGLGFGYRVSKKLELQTGIMVNNWHQSATGLRLKVTPSSITTSNTSFDISGNTSSGNLNFNSSSDPTNQGKLETANVGGQVYSVLPGLEESYQFIEVPVTIGYYLVDSKRWFVRVNLGLNSRFISQSDVKLIYSDGTEVDYDGIELETYSMQLIGGVGAGYKISEHWSFGLQPTLLYGITKVNTHSEVNTYFHQALVYCSLSYHF